MMRKRILFLCTANSARSQMAEAMVNHDLGDRFAAFSAGTVPTAPRPEALEVLAELGIDHSHARSKSLDEFADQTFDFVITLCDGANETCPLFFGGVRREHFGFPDPARAWERQMKSWPPSAASATRFGGPWKNICWVRTMRPRIRSRENTHDHEKRSARKNSLVSNCRRGAMQWMRHMPGLLSPRRVCQGTAARPLFSFGTPSHASSAATTARIAAPNGPSPSRSRSDHGDHPQASLGGVRRGRLPTPRRVYFQSTFRRPVSPCSFSMASMRAG